MRQRFVAAGREPDPVGERLGHLAFVADPGQIDEERPVGVRGLKCAAGRYREPGLPTPTRTGECDEPVLVEQPHDRAHVLVATDQRRAWNRQCRDGRRLGPQRRKLLAHAFGADLEQAHRVGDTPQSVLTECCGVVTDQQVGGHPRHNDLAAMAGVADPCGPIHRWAEVVAVPFISRADVHTDPHRDDCRHRPRLRRHRPLDRHTRVYRVVGESEGGREAVTTRREDDAPAVLDGPADDQVVAGHGSRHRLAVRIPQRCRALDVGEQERNRSGRWRSAHQPGS